MSVHPTAKAASTINHALSMVEPLARWLIRSGVGYSEFTSALKTVFFDEALLEAKRIGQKPTDSALSLLAGMHRKDISTLRTAKNQDNLPVTPIRKSISMSSQVLGHWLAKQLPPSLPLQAIDQSENNFDALVRSISNDKHPRSVLKELERLGAVRVSDNTVHLLEQAFIPKASTVEAHDIFAANISDHLAAGVHNLSQAESNNERQFLEQSVFADELTAESAQALCHLSAQTWGEIMQKILQEALALNDQHAGLEQATHRFRVGMYAYSENEASEKTL